MLEEITINLSAVLFVLDTIVLIGAVIGLYAKAVKPVKDREKAQKEKTEKVDKKLEDHEMRLDKGEKRFDQIAEMSKVQCYCLFALINHELSGNDVKKLEEAKNKLQNYVIDNSQ